MPLLEEQDESAMTETMTRSTIPQTLLECPEGLPCLPTNLAELAKDAISPSTPEIRSVKELVELLDSPPETTKKAVKRLLVPHLLAPLSLG